MCLIDSVYTLLLCFDPHCRRKMIDNRFIIHFTMANAEILLPGEHLLPRVSVHIWPCLLVYFAFCGFIFDLYGSAFVLGRSLFCLLARLVLGFVPAPYLPLNHLTDSIALVYSFPRFVFIHLRTLTRFLACFHIIIMSSLLHQFITHLPTHLPPTPLLAHSLIHLLGHTLTHSLQSLSLAHSLTPMHTLALNFESLASSSVWVTVFLLQNSNGFHIARFLPYSENVIRGDTFAKRIKIQATNGKVCNESRTHVL